MSYSQRFLPKVKQLEPSLKTTCRAINAIVIRNSSSFALQQAPERVETVGEKEVRTPLTFPKAWQVMQQPDNASLLEMFLNCDCDMDKWNDVKTLIGLKTSAAEKEVHHVIEITSLLYDQTTAMRLAKSKTLTDRYIVDCIIGRNPSTDSSASLSLRSAVDRVRNKEKSTKDIMASYIENATYEFQQVVNVKYYVKFRAIHHSNSKESFLDSIIAYSAWLLPYVVTGYGIALLIQDDEIAEKNDEETDWSAALDEADNTPSTLKL